MSSKKEQILAIARELKRVQGGLADIRRANNLRFVIGEGNLNAKLVFVGEAPGKQEAATGRPFAGAAGKVLDEALQRAGLHRKDVYITNIVNDRPPNNRDPEPAELACYSPFLLRQLEIIKPMTIATLGRISMRFLLEHFGVEEPNFSIGRLHGRTFTVDTSWGKVTIAPLYHPAATIYNPELKETLAADIDALKD